MRPGPAPERPERTATPERPERTATPERPERTRRVAGTWACTIVALAALAGCGGARNSLGTDASPCFRGLPAAQRDAGKGRHLVGVRRVSPSTLQHRFPNDRELVHVTGDICLYAFRGPFDKGAVTTGADAGGQPTTNDHPGRYLVVAVTSRHSHFLLSRVVDRLPTRFTHRR